MRLLLVFATLLLSACASPPQSASGACWDPVEHFVANAIPWAPKQAPNCPG